MATKTITPEPGELTKQVKHSARRPPAAGKGRPKGSPNKTTTAVKEMILQALDGAGGVEYLQRQADANPSAFMTLVGKVLPLQLAGTNDDGSQAPFRIELIGVRPK